MNGLITMRGNRKRRISSTAGLGLALAGVAAFAAACGSSSDTASGSSSASSGSSSSSSSSSSSPAAGSDSSSSTGMVSSISAKSSDLGTYLTDNNGNTLYLFAKDTNGKSTCNGQCLAEWPALKANSLPKAGSGVMAGKLSLITRDDGSKQVAYDGHALYYFSGDSSKGDMKGQGLDDNGAKWWLVGPDGKQITKTASSTANDGGGSGSGAGGGWS